MENIQPNSNEKGRRKSRVALAEVKRKLETDADSPLRKASSTTETTLQRVPPTYPSVPTVHLQRVSTTELSTPFLPPPLPRPSRTPNKATCLFRPVIAADVPPQSQHFFNHIGRRFIDTETNERFSILSVVFPTQTTGKGCKTCHFR